MWKHLTEGTVWSGFTLFANEFLCQISLTRVKLVSFFMSSVWRPDFSHCEWMHFIFLLHVGSSHFRMMPYSLKFPPHLNHLILMRLFRDRQVNSLSLVRFRFKLTWKEEQKISCASTWHQCSSNWKHSEMWIFCVYECTQVQVTNLVTCLVWSSRAKYFFLCKLHACYQWFFKLAG